LQKKILWFYQKQKKAPNSSFTCSMRKSWKLLEWQ